MSWNRDPEVEHSGRLYGGCGTWGELTEQLHDIIAELTITYIQTWVMRKIHSFIIYFQTMLTPVWITLDILVYLIGKENPLLFLYYVIFCVTFLTRPPFHK